MRYRDFYSSLKLQRKAIIGLCTLIVALSTGSAARAEFKLTTDLKDGDKVHDISVVIAHAESSDGIDKVEFFEDDQLKATATGTPYKFTWDTIADTEGKHNIAITAYDSNGQTKKLTLALEIDNELPLGAVALAKKAQAALVANDTDAALAYSRRSTKAEPGNIEAARVTAALAARDSDWTKAVASIEKSNGYDNNPDAIRELAGYKLKMTLLPENAANFSSNLISIVDLRQKSADMSAANTKATDPSNHLAIGDALLRAGNAKDAQLEYQKAGDAMPLELANRVALAYALQDNTELSIAYMRPRIADKMADRVTRAIYGLCLLREQKFEAARAAVAADLGSGYPAAEIIAAYADVVNGETAKAAAEAEAAVKAAPDAGDAHYVSSMTIRSLTDSEAELVRTISATPFASGPYVDFAARLALQKPADRFDDAVKLVDFVLKREPDNTGAKLVRVLLLTARGRGKEVSESLDYVVRHNKAPDVKMVAAVYLTEQKQVGLANQFWDEAVKADKVHFQFLVVPNPTQFLSTYERKQHYRAGFFLTFESLFPPKPVVVPVVPTEAGQ